MFTSVRHESNVQFYLRWIARLLSAVSVAAIILFVFAENVGWSALAWKEGILVLLFPFGVFAGLILGWEDELSGGIVAVSSIVLFYVLYAFAYSGSIHETWWILLIASPGFLFFLYGFLAFRSDKSGAGLQARR